MTENNSKYDTEFKNYRELQYFRYTSDRGGADRGALCLLDKSGEKVVREIPSFPHINRVYKLKEGLKHFFGDDTFFAEEKLDGYNARFFCHEGRIFAATRGGIICPFTTEWTGIWKDKFQLKPFFEENPDKILCAEICGDNPYNSQRYSELSPGAHFFLFDIMKKDGSFHKPETRYQISEKYGFPLVSRFGEFKADDTRKLYEILYDLNERHREGLVLKSRDSKKVLKFVTPSRDLEDIRDGLIIDFDLHHRYFINRILRTVLFIQEFNLDRRAYARRIGKTILDGYSPLESFEKAAETFTIYVIKRGTWKAVQQLIGAHVSAEKDEIEKTELEGRKMLKIKFRRVYDKSTNRYHTILKGFPHTD